MKVAVMKITRCEAQHSILEEAIDAVEVMQEPCSMEDAVCETCGLAIGGTTCHYRGRAPLHWGCAVQLASEHIQLGRTKWHRWQRRLSHAAQWESTRSRKKTHNISVTGASDKASERGKHHVNQTIDADPVHLTGGGYASESLVDMCRRWLKIVEYGLYAGAAYVRAFADGVITTMRHKLCKRIVPTLTANLGAVGCGKAFTKKLRGGNKCLQRGSRGVLSL